MTIDNKYSEHNITTFAHSRPSAPEQNEEEEFLSLDTSIDLPDTFAFVFNNNDDSEENEEEGEEEEENFDQFAREEHYEKKWRGLAKVVLMILFSLMLSIIIVVIVDAVKSTKYNRERSKWLLYLYKLSRAETFASSKIREIYNIHFREMGDQKDNFHPKNGFTVTNASWITRLLR